jgi:ABC-type glycerol-3-phosphate transport system permease component
MFAEILERLRRSACIQIRRACRQKPRRWIALWQMLVPIAAPSILTTSVLNFLFCWNEFLFALILNSQNALTFLPSLLRYELPQGPLYGQIFAGSTIFLLPPLFALFLIRRHFSTGFGMGAVR